ncbi:MAG TPA: hypothetical protein VJC20_01500 [Candidatus Paceibacterota bacterium]
MAAEIKIGILFHSMTTAIIAVISLAFVVFLIRRWRALDDVRRAYTGFWIVTMLVWSAITARYFMIGMGYWGGDINAVDRFIQSMVFFTGPPLYYYVGLRLFSDKRAAIALATASLIFSIIGMRFVLREDGLVRVAITNFSTETNLNPTSYQIFLSNIVMLVVLIAYDFFLRIRQWIARRDIVFLYDALYSAALLVYVGLGGIDNSKIFLEWGLVILRIFYSAAFVFAYSVIIGHTFAQDNFLIEEK